MRDFLGGLRFPRKGAGGGRLYTPRSRSACGKPPCGTSNRFRRAGVGVRHRRRPARAALGTPSADVIAPSERHTPVPPDPRPRTRGRSMDAFTAGLLQRIRATESDLTRARETGDDFLVDVEQSELDDRHRLAAEHGVEVTATRV